MDEKIEKMFASLNTDQKEAVEKLDGPVCVLAGPGSGKTQVLALRVAYILENVTGISPQNILCITYTDAGCLAMRNRLTKIIGPSAFDVEIRTMHSFCEKVANIYELRDKEYELISELERTEVISFVLSQVRENTQLFTPYDKNYYNTHCSNLFRIIKQEGWSVSEFKKHCIEYIKQLPTREKYIYKKKYGNFAAGDVKIDAVQEVTQKINLTIEIASLYDNYQAELNRRRRYEYDDMIPFVIKALNEKSFLRYELQEKYQYILVDEFQDCNGSQYKLIEELIKNIDAPNLFTVGDDDQSIYRFQGASLENFNNLKQTCGNSLEIKALNINYRSTKSIIEAANKFINLNVSRIGSGIKKVKPAAEEIGELIKIVENESIYHEAIHVVNEIKVLLDNGNKPEDIAILYKEHKQGNIIVELLNQNSIPYKVQKQKDILENKSVQSLIDILDFINTELSKPGLIETKLLNILRSVFDISASDLAKLYSIYTQKTQDQKSLLSYLNIATPATNYDLSAKKAYDTIEKWLKESLNLGIEDIIKLIINESELINIGDKKENIFAVSSLLHFISHESSFGKNISINEFLSKIEDMREMGIPINETYLTRDERGVKLMTIYASKGLEFKHVYIVGTVESIWKQKNKLNLTLPDNLVLTTRNDEGEGIEEMRRLLYVAMTRAIKTLTLSYYKTDVSGRNQTQSRYISELHTFDHHKQIQSTIEQSKIDEYLLKSIALQPNTNESYFDADVIEKFTLQYKLSASHLSSYLKCQTAFYFEHVLKVKKEPVIQMIFGNVLHKVMEIANKKTVIGVQVQMSDLTEVYETELAKNSRLISKTQHDKFLALAPTLLAKYLTQKIPYIELNTKSELFIKEVQISKTPCHGKLDKIIFNDEGTEATLTDYKTRIDTKKRKIKTIKGEIDEYTLQLIFYKLLLEEKTHHKTEVTSLHIESLLPNIEDTFDNLTIEANKENIDLTKTLIEETYKGIVAGNFQTGCKEDKCSWCNFILS